MLPPGHMAAGYLVAKALLKQPALNITKKQKAMLAWWGTLLAFLPDIDIFYAFYKSSGLTINPAVANHRVYLTHTPLLWLIAGLLVFFLAKKPQNKIAGLLVWLAPWSHFLLDSIDSGIRWLWPLSGRLVTLVPDASGAAGTTGRDFVEYWLGFLSSYSHSATFYLEIIIIITAAVVFVKSYIISNKS